MIENFWFGKVFFKIFNMTDLFEFLKMCNFPGYFYVVCFRYQIVFVSYIHDIFTVPDMKIIRFFKN